MSKLDLSILFSVCVHALVPERDRPAGDPPVLRVAGAEPALLPVLARVHRQGRADLPHPEDPEDLQTVATHHRPQDSRHHAEEQPQVDNRFICRYLNIKLNR